VPDRNLVPGQLFELFVQRGLVSLHGDQQMRPMGGDRVGVTDLGVQSVLCGPGRYADRGERPLALGRDRCVAVGIITAS
jgi:hypothetical protein